MSSYVLINQGRHQLWETKWLLNYLLTFSTKYSSQNNHKNITVNSNINCVCVCSQNCMEFYPLFLATPWTCGMFFSEVAAVAGWIMYIFAQQIYFNGYIKSTKKRLFISWRKEYANKMDRKTIPKIWNVIFHNTRMTECYLVCRLSGFGFPLSLLSLTGIVSGVLHKYFHIHLWKFHSTSTTEHHTGHLFALQSGIFVCFKAYLKVMSKNAKSNKINPYLSFNPCYYWVVFHS